MKISSIIFILSLFVSIKSDYDLVNDVAKSIKVTSGQTYKAYIAAKEGQDVQIELSMDYSSHKKSPFTKLHIYEYETKEGFAIHEKELSLSSLDQKVEGQKLVLAKKYNIWNFSCKIICLEFISSSDISDLQLKISVSGTPTRNIIFWVLFFPVLCCIICALGILCFFKNLCCPSKPRPRPIIVQPTVYTPLQPQIIYQTQPIIEPISVCQYPPDQPQSQQFFPTVQQQAIPGQM